MPLDIQLFRADQGGNPQIIIESQQKRFKPTEIVQQIIELDNQWRKAQTTEDDLNEQVNNVSKAVGNFYKIAKNDGKRKLTAEETAEVAKLKLLSKEHQLTQKQAKITQIALKMQRDALLNLVGNLVYSDVPVSKDEHENALVKEWGHLRRNPNQVLRHHHELLYMIGGYEPEKGTKICGHRGYFLTGPGVILNMALQNYGISFLLKQKYTPVYPPYFMNKNIMARTAQLEDFNEALYHVTGENSDMEKYLIATSEQPISAMHLNDTLTPDELPLRYAGISTCFRKEAGAHGKDAWGIFRVHQFDKIEQFVYCAPRESWRFHEEMIGIAAAFYESLRLPYRVVNIVSGELNNAAAKKYDLEGWFPTLQRYRELVSASNCTDYQAIAMNTRFGFPKQQRKSNDNHNNEENANANTNANVQKKKKEYVHMLNATLCATTRTICAILENFQTDDGVNVPAALQPYCHGLTFIPFVRPPPVNKEAKPKKQKKAGKKQKNQNKKQKKKPKTATIDAPTDATAAAANVSNNTNTEPPPQTNQNTEANAQNANVETN